MDVEERFARIESAIDKVAGNKVRLDGALAALAEAQIETVRLLNAFIDEADKA